jgi:hypothetical protein
MQTFEYFARYNTRITFETDASGEGGTAITGGASTIVTANLTPNRVLISTAGGKVDAHSTVTPTTLGYVDIGSSLTGLLAGKEPTLTKGNLTEATSSVLTITGGTAAIIGSGLTIQVAQASGSTSGYLSSANWTTFNNKLSTSLTDGRIFVGNASNVATGVVVSGDITITNAGVVQIASGVIVNGDVHASAAIDRTKIANGTNYRILANSATGVMSENAALTAGRAIVSDSNGQLIHATTTTAQVNFLSTTTSDVQTQLSTLIVGKATNALIQSPGAGQAGFAITWDNTASEYTLTDPVVQGIPTGGSSGQIIVKNSASDFDCSWTTNTLSLVTDVTATAADVNLLSGQQVAGLTAVHLGYVIGVTSNIQTQIGTKLSATLPHNAIFVGNASNVATAYAAGSEGQVLQISGGVPVWQTIAGTGSVTSVAISGGTTGISVSGSPITTSGTITLSGTLVAANGGTGQSTYAVGDILQASGATTLSKLAAVATGNVLISGGVTTVSSWGKVGLTSHVSGILPVANGGTGLSTIAALSIWVADTLDTVTTVTPTAGQSIRINAGGTAWEAYTPGGGGGLGGSTGAVDNAILRADGTGGATVQTSAVVIGDTANVTLGTSAIAGSSRTITPDGSGSDVGVTISGKGTGSVILSSGGATVSASNGVVGLTGTGNISFLTTTGVILSHFNDATTNTVARIHNFRRSSTGTPATGIGGSIGFEVETAADNYETGVILEIVTTDVTSASEDFDFVIKTMAGGAAAAEAVRIKSDKSTTLQGPIVLKSYTVAGVPAAGSHTGGMVYVTNESGGAIPAFSDGTNWRRVSDRNVIS